LPRLTSQNRQLRSRFAKPRLENEQKGGRPWATREGPAEEACELAAENGLQATASASIDCAAHALEGGAMLQKPRRPALVARPLSPCGVHGLLIDACLRLDDPWRE
jgi:hypothetical protein